MLILYYSHIQDNTKLYPSVQVIILKLKIKQLQIKFLY